MVTRPHDSFSRRGLALAAFCAAAFAIVMQGAPAQAAALLLG